MPDNLYLYMAELSEKVVKAPEQILYETSQFAETVSLYFEQHQAKNKFGDLSRFEGKVLDIFANVTDKNKRNLVILDQSGFYPTSGGQAHDTGRLRIAGKDYKVINVEKVGRVVMHTLDAEVADWQGVIGQTAEGWIDMDRRIQLRNNHTSAHIVFAACRKVLGPHVWQNGAKKTPQQAHLDITHYNSLTNEQELEIERVANQIVLENNHIDKGVRLKSDAEKEHGFSLYQGGVVPGNELRVVNIKGVDVEACCGTHCDNTSEVGWIKLLTTKRIADGIVRLYFVAGRRSLEVLEREKKVLMDLEDLWGVSQDKVVETAKRIFKENKKNRNDLDDALKEILQLSVKTLVLNPNVQKLIVISKEDDPKLYFSNIGNYADELKQGKKSIVFVGKTFIFMFVGDNDLKIGEELGKFLELPIKSVNKVKVKDRTVDNVQVVSAVSKNDIKDPIEFLKGKGFTHMK